MAVECRERVCACMFFVSSSTAEWFVIHHTDCGMEYFKSDELAKLLETSLATAKIVPSASARKGVTFENAKSEGAATEFQLSLQVLVTTEFHSNTTYAH